MQSTKVLQLGAGILCHVFCGLKLLESGRRLVELGSGTLEIDALAATSRFNGRTVDELPIDRVVHKSLESWLTYHNIDMKLLQRARLTALIRIAFVESAARRTSEFHVDPRGRFIQDGKFHQLRISCQSEIAAGKALYRATENTVKEFPYP